jgi:DNA-binding transcriptional LysR family regulator
LPLAVECDDLSLLKALAETTDTVVGCSDAACVQDVATGRLIRLDVAGIPPMFADMAIVSLKGRSYSPVAQFAVEFIVQQTQG